MVFDLIIACPAGAAPPTRCTGALHRAAGTTHTLNIVLFGVGGPPPKAGAEARAAGGFKSAAKGRNAAAALGGGPWLLFLDADCLVEPDFFVQLAACIAAQPGTAGFVCRVLPGDYQPHIDPATLQAPWLEGGAFAVRRDAFAAAGGFDARLPHHGAEADLSWRMRAAGHTLGYLPGAVALREAPPPDTLGSYAGDTLGALLLAGRYGSFCQRLAAGRAYRGTLRAPRHFTGVRRLLLRRYLGHLATLPLRWLWRLGHGALRRAVAPMWAQYGGALLRGASPLAVPLRNGPLISVVVRTHRRPQVLRRALQSLANQTYQSLEVVVVEDGEATAREVALAEYGTLPLRYHATGTPVGRGVAGNLGLSMATGDYLIFLDDDDAFYPDQLELMAERAIAHPEADLVLGCAMAEMVRQAPDGPVVEAVRLVRFDRIDLFSLCQVCNFPIQSVLFKKQLYQRCGGLAEDMDAHEDWAMWLRFFKYARRIHPRRLDVTRAGSVFTQPADTGEQQARLAGYARFDGMLFGDPELVYTLSMADLRAFYDGMIDDLRHLHRTGQTAAFLESQAHRGGLDGPGGG